MLSTEEIRKSMRITHTHLDEEIKRNINTALRDLRRVGINTEDNDLIDKACELYVKAQLDYQGKGDLILSRLVDTFSSRILYPMLLLSGNHSIAAVLSWEEGLH